MKGRLKYNQNEINFASFFRTDKKVASHPLHPIFFLIHLPELPSSPSINLLRRLKSSLRLSIWQLHHFSIDVSIPRAWKLLLIAESLALKSISYIRHDGIGCQFQPVGFHNPLTIGVDILQAWVCG